MNNKKSGWRQHVPMNKVLPFLQSNIQMLRTPEEIAKIVEQNTILEGDSQETIDKKFEILKNLISEENQKVGVNYFLEAFRTFLLTNIDVKSIKL